MPVPSIVASRIEMLERIIAERDAERRALREAIAGLEKDLDALDARLHPHERELQGLRLAVNAYTEQEQTGTLDIDINDIEPLAVVTEQQSGPQADKPAPLHERVLETIKHAPGPMQASGIADALGIDNPRSVGAALGYLSREGLIVPGNDGWLKTPLWTPVWKGEKPL